MRLLYLELSNIVAKLSKLNPRLNEIIDKFISQKTQGADKKSIKMHKEKILRFYKAIKEIQENGKKNKKLINYGRIL